MEYKLKFLKDQIFKITSFDVQFWKKLNREIITIKFFSYLFYENHRFNC